MSKDAKGTSKKLPAVVELSAVAGIKKDNCPDCDKSVEDTDSALECEICENWFHINCEDLEEEDYTFLSVHKTVHWYCKSCNKNVAKVIKLVSSLKGKVEVIEKNVSTLSAQVAVCENKLSSICEGKLPDSLDKVLDLKINEAVAKYETSVNGLKTDFQGLKDLVSATDTKLETAIEAKLVKSVETIKKDLEPTFATIVGNQVKSQFESVSRDVSTVQSVLDDTRKKALEERDRENRSHNIIIYRVPEPDNKDEMAKADKLFCIELFNSVLEVETKESEFKSFRLGKKTQQNRPLMIQCREKTLKNHIMESLNKLKDAEPKFKNVSIAHDLTASERTECKNLVEEAKKKQTEETGEYLWRVRGPPGQLKLVKLKKH